MNAVGGVGVAVGTKEREKRSRRARDAVVVVVVERRGRGREREREERREWGVRTPTGTAPPSFIQRSGRLVEVVVRAPQPRQLGTRVSLRCVSVSRLRCLSLLRQTSRPRETGAKGRRHFSHGGESRVRRGCDNVESHRRYASYIFLFENSGW